MEYKDYYKILGVSRDTTEDEIKRAYRKLARKYHPDVSKEANAEEHFKEVQEAYEVLKDKQKRAAYDQLGSNWKSGQEFRPPPNWGGSGGGGGFEEADGVDFSDFFASIFGGGGGGGRHQRSGFRQSQHAFHQRGSDEHAKIAISLEEAFSGGSKTVNLQVQEMGPHGQMQNIMRKLKITIPKGVVSGQQLRLTQQGGPGMGGAESGDLYLEIDVRTHPIFALQGRDVYLTLPVTPWEAALGAKITIPTLAGPVEMKIASGTQAGQKLRLKGRGLPGKPNPGDQYAMLQIVTPPAHTESERALYEQMAKEMPFNPRKGLL
ncbi:MAG: DnaJ C-terminal domain-containing protein [Gammaproteobacteria bacterium]